jgi:hypothetical protein
MVKGDHVRRVALSLPEAHERETWGEATFRVRDKIFATLSERSGEASVKASLDEQAALVALDPESFSVASYVGRFGWVSIQLATVDPDDLTHLLIEAWRQTAPKSLVATYDAGMRESSTDSAQTRQKG